MEIKIAAISVKKYVLLIIVVSVCDGAGRETPFVPRISNMIFILKTALVSFCIYYVQKIMWS